MSPGKWLFQLKKYFVKPKPTVASFTPSIHPWVVLQSSRFVVSTLLWSHNLNNNTLGDPDAWS